MSKGLKALSKIAKRVGTLKVDNNGMIYNSLGDMYESYKIIRKELKVLEIVKNKRVPIQVIFEFDTYDDYFEWAYSNVIRLYLLTQEEFNLLKEVLADD